MDRALRPAVDQREEMTAALIRRGHEHVGVAGIDDHVGHAGVLRDLQHLRPRLPAIGRLVEAAVAARGPQRALGGHVDGVAVFRIDDDAADVLGGVEPDVGPRSPAVVALVDAVAIRDRSLRVAFAGPDPDDVRTPGVERDPPDRVRPLRVEDRLPGGAAVDRLPDAARCGADVEDGAVGGIHGNGHDAAGGDGGPDRPRARAREAVGQERLRKNRAARDGGK